MSKVQIGLIGCGRIAQAVHLPVLASLPGVEVVALAEPEPQRREEARRWAPRALVFAQYEDLLTDPQVEAVVVCLPNALHAAAAAAALQAGRPVYLEKPLATSLAEAQAVVTTWRRCAQVAMIGFNYRFHPLVEVAREQIAAGRLGELVAARSAFASSIRPLPGWKEARLSGGGALLDLASHHLDLVHYLLGDNVRDVFAQLRSLRSEHDTATVQLRLTNDLPVQSFFSLSAVEEDRFEVYGQAGKLVIDRYRSLNVEISEPAVDFRRSRWVGRAIGSLVGSPHLLNKARMPSGEPSYRAALAHFVSAVQSGQPAKPDLYDGYRSLALVAAAEESASTGRPVAVIDPFYAVGAP